MSALTLTTLLGSVDPPPRLLACADGSLTLAVVCLVAIGVAAISLLWALLERSERLVSLERNNELSIALGAISDQHYRERLQAEERHLLSFDSATRNILESLERSALGKPKP